MLGVASRVGGAILAVWVGWGFKAEDGDEGRSPGDGVEGHLDCGSGVSMPRRQSERGLGWSGAGQASERGSGKRTGPNGRLLRIRNITNQKSFLI